MHNVHLIKTSNTRHAAEGNSTRIAHVGNVWRRQDSESGGSCGVHVVIQSHRWPRLVPRDARPTGAIALLVEEREASDEVVQAVEAGDDIVLRVVAQQLEEGNHGEAAVLELAQLAALKLLGLELRLARVEVAEEAPVIDGADQEDDLGPAEGRDGIDGGDTVRDVGELDARGNLAGEAVELRDDVADDGELGNAPVLELGGAVLRKGILVNVAGEVEGVEEAGGLDHAELVLVRGRHGESAGAHRRLRAGEAGRRKGLHGREREGEHGCDCWN
mmetsp:Transcript_13525/g.44165  ORF Transcript_13525/g.44165 Transcript_13525/m.44165 type:complete len:274 (-) Transcript_13525:63-884(-)